MASCKALAFLLVACIFGVGLSFLSESETLSRLWALDDTAPSKERPKERQDKKVKNIGNEELVEAKKTSGQAQYSHQNLGDNAVKRSKELANHSVNETPATASPSIVFQNEVGQDFLPSSSESKPHNQSGDYLSFKGTFSPTSEDLGSGPRNEKIPWPQEQHNRSRAFGLGIAHPKLKDLLERIRNETAVKIAVLGGSVSAGGGNITAEKRYFSHYTHWLKNLTSSPRKITLSNYAQGGENSLYGALLFSAIVPLDTDLIFWEYSPNDKTYPGLNGCCRPNDMIYIQDAFLRRVSSMNPLPVVILVYTWSIPSHKDLIRGRSIKDKSLRSTKDHALQFPFVAGYVSLVEELLQNPNLPKLVPEVEEMFFADKVHPNEKGHTLMGKLLIDLSVMASSSSSKSATNGASLIPQPKWPCDDNGLSIRNALAEVQYTQAWTALQPSIPNQQLSLVFYEASQKKVSPIEDRLKFIINGKTSQIRIDRKYSLELPCCSRDEYLRFNITSATRQKALNFRVDYPDDLIVYISSSADLDSTFVYKAPLIDAFSWTSTSCVLRTFPNGEFRLWVDLDSIAVDPKYVFICENICNKSDTHNTLRWFTAIGGQV